MAYVPDETTLREFTVRSVLTGTLLGIIFGASSLFLTLKVGLTVSASIPVAVISMALWRALSKLLPVRDGTILEHNIAQTAGSAGESLAFGVGVTMPAILILGFDLELMRVLVVALLGGLLGILLMIPLRRALIVQQHGILKYPEGTACAEVLKAGACDHSRAAAAGEHQRAAQLGGVNAKTIFGGLFIGLLYNVLSRSLKLWNDAVGYAFGAPLKGGSVGAEISPEMLGVGYIIGPRISGVMMAGGVLSYLVLIPIIKFFGEWIPGPVAPATKPISAMGIGEIRSEYILYIGAGAVTAGGLVSLARALPTIWRGLRAGLADFSGDGPTERPLKTPRTQRDLPLKFVVGGVVVLLAGVTLFLRTVTGQSSIPLALVGALLVLVLGFLFVTVSSRLTGEIGSSSNPVSGMTIATLLFTCLLFLLCGFQGGSAYVAALSVGAIVCIACSNGGTTSQDLKTGFLIGGTPARQQMAILIGAAASALVLGPVLLLLNNNATTYIPAAKVGAAALVAPAREISPRREGMVGPHRPLNDAQTYAVWHQPDPAGGAARKFLLDDAGHPLWLVDPGINGKFPKTEDGREVRKYDAPKATLVSLIIKGILDQKLPWALVLFGVMIALTLELCGIGSLAFAVGVYLPMAVSAPIFIGGGVRWLVDRASRSGQLQAGLTEEEIIAESDKSPGVLMASGYIAGGSIAGIVVAASQGMLEGFDIWVTNLSQRVNPFFEGASHPYAGALSLIPFGILCALLYLAARGRILAVKQLGR